MSVAGTCAAIALKLGVDLRHPHDLRGPYAHDVANIGAFAAAYLLGVGLIHARTVRRPEYRLPDLWLISIAVTGIALLALTMTRVEIVRSAAAFGFVSLVLLLPAPYALRPILRPWALGVFVVPAAAALLALIVLDPTHAARIRPAKATTEWIKTEYYTLEKRTFDDLIPRPAVKGGGITRWGDSYLVASGDGLIYRLELDNAWNRPRVSRMQHRIPINGETFARAAGRAWSVQPRDTTAWEGSLTAENVHPEYFRVSGLLAQQTAERVRLFASHMFWYPDRGCWVTRVSALEAGSRDLLERGDAQWRTVFETTPCLPAAGPNRRRGVPVVGYFGGGRMAVLDDEHILVTVGDYGFDGLASPTAVSQDRGTTYGKTIKIRIADGHATIFALGQRNPQGLYIDPSGAIWSTEHGPQGGDELNRLVEGANYGWPLATFGTDYGSSHWPGAAVQGEHDGFELPMFAWVPSIGVSQVIGVERAGFPLWKGDLLVASLKAQSLFRARIRSERVTYVEPIHIGCDVRDLIEAKDGQLLVWSHQCGLVTLQARGAVTGEALLAERCSGCHQSELVSGNRIGPNLHGVVGRPIASLRGYPDYSHSLRRKGGVWDRTTLDQFLANPAAFVPGTTMDISGVPSKRDRDAIIDFLAGVH
jgi:cytochrome c2